MNARKFVSILILVSTVLIIIGGCATTSKTKEEREVFFKTVMSGNLSKVKRLKG